MSEKTNFTILHIITESDLCKFHERIKAFEEGKKIITKQIFVSAVPFNNGSGSGVMSIPSCYFEYEATEQSYKSWKFGNSLKV